MIQKIEINIPAELVKEIEGYVKSEGITFNEFLFWALGEKIGELRAGRGVKSLVRFNPSKPPEKPFVDRGEHPLSIPKRLLKAEEVARYLKISKSGAYQLMKTGVIPVVRLGRTVRVREEDLEEALLNTRISAI